MDQAIVKRLIDEGIIDFDKLLLRNYKQIGLSEIEAFLLIELNNQKKTGDTLISPSKLTKKLTLPEERVTNLLDALIQRNYISIRLVKTEGKEKEDFSFETTLNKLVEVYKSKIKFDITHSSKTYDTIEEEIVDLLESQFQKQLKPADIELIMKWVNEDKFSLAEIKNAVVDAVKSNKSTLGYIDAVLLKRSKNRNKPKKKYKPEKSEALKAFYDSWEQK